MATLHQILLGIGNLIALPVVQVILGAIIGATASLGTTYFHLRQQQRTAGIDWITAYAAKIEKIIGEFKPLPLELNISDSKMKQQTITNFNHMADTYFKNAMLLPYGTRDELEALLVRGRLAAAILKMRTRNQAKIDATIQLLEREEGELDDIKELEGAALGLVLLEFMIAYRRVLIAIHDAVIVSLENLLEISKLVGRKANATPDG